jgi:hypothetical protein
MSDAEMRKLIKGAYHSEAWHKKVDRMSRNQVFAVYTEFASQKKI